MSIRRIDGIQLTCDGCGKFQFVETAVLPAHWYRGQVTASDGEDSWDACSEQCIAKAVLLAARRATGEVIGRGSRR